MENFVVIKNAGERKFICEHRKTWKIVCKMQKTKFNAMFNEVKQVTRNENGESHIS